MVRSSRFEKSSCQNDASSVLEWISLPCSVAQGKKYVVQIDPLVGEVLRAIHISEADFETLQGSWFPCSVFSMLNQNGNSTCEPYRAKFKFMTSCSLTHVYISYSFLLVLLFGNCHSIQNGSLVSTAILEGECLKSMLPDPILKAHSYTIWVDAVIRTVDSQKLFPGWRQSVLSLESFVP